MNLEIPQQTTTDSICIGLYIRTRNCHTQQFVSDQILLNLWSQKDYLQSWETQNLECFGSTRKLGPVSSQDFTRENFNLEKKKKRAWLFVLDNWQPEKVVVCFSGFCNSGGWFQQPCFLRWVFQQFAYSMIIFVDAIDISVLPFCLQAQWFSPTLF